MSGGDKSTDLATAIRAIRKTSWLGDPMIYYPSVTSTNDILAEMASAGTPVGAMVLTDYQSQGKGRLGRRWLAPRGTSLLVSLLFRPLWPPEKAPWLTMLAGLAAVEAIETCTGLRPHLKWPNDLILLDGVRWQKLGGLLLEGQIVDGRWVASILGIGINVNIKPEEIPEARLPATSLLKETGREIDRAVLLNELLASLEYRYELAEQGQSPRQAWQSRLLTIGQQVTVSQLENRSPLTGVAVRTDEWGRLIVRDPAGHEHAISAGDVTLQVDNSRE